MNDIKSNRNKGIVVFSGGSAANNLVDVFGNLAESKNFTLTYVIPISDNGGSSSELIRVFGGPGIGDLRSRHPSLGSLQMLNFWKGRLVRLIPSSTLEKSALKDFFNHRLSKEIAEAREEWLSIVEASHSLWDSISGEKKELIRSFLNLLNFEIVKRVRPSSKFNFQSASLGNLFLTGARIFCGSLESAVYLLRSICGIPDGVEVLPAINSNFTHHISAGLADGTSIVGQNSISHPSLPSALSDPIGSEDSTSETRRNHEDEADTVEDANLPGSLPTLRKQNIVFTKTEEQDLPTRIERIWYINPYGQEIRPPINPKVVTAIKDSQSLIYSIGSLYTSIVPCLILKGVGTAILDSAIKYKILLLNGTLDRETGPSSSPFTALDFVQAIARACKESGGSISASEGSELRKYVTHLIYLEGERVPKVDRTELSALGIECVRIYGRRENGQVRYDGKALGQALEVITGRGDRIRRMTMGD